MNDSDFSSALLLQILCGQVINNMGELKALLMVLYVVSTLNYCDDLCVDLIGSEHAELSRQIKEARDDNLCDDLERELDSVIERMEIKGNQITKLRRLQSTVS